MIAYRGRLADTAASCDPKDWILRQGIMPRAFEVLPDDRQPDAFCINGDLSSVSAEFNKGKSVSPFLNSGFMIDRRVYTMRTTPQYTGPYLTLGDILTDSAEVPEEFFISDNEIEKWRYAKGSKSEKRVNKTTGYEYRYSEGAMAFPDDTSKPSRTIITGEGGATPSRFKHIIRTNDGKFRRLTPIELERLNMFPDNHTSGATSVRRAFLMGNALVTGIVERLGVELLNHIGL